MQCRSPYYLSRALQSFIVSCGKCYCCKVNRIRVWQTRIILEADAHEYSSFVTLTYNNDNLPKVVTHNGTIRGNLCPRDLQLFFKRLRRYAELQGIKHKIRYYAVGEYGDRTWRPHYHICLYGLDFRHEELIKKSWNRGFIHIGSLTTASAGYAAGYIEKKMTNPKDNRLFGRYPEFFRCSNRPGIGFNYVEKLVNCLKPFKNKPEVEDVPRTIRLPFFNIKTGDFKIKRMPLGRYIRSKVRLKLWGHDCAPPAILDKAREQLDLLKEEFYKLRSDFVDFRWNFMLFLREKFRNSGVAAEQASLLYRYNNRSL